MITDFKMHKKGGIMNLSFRDLTVYKKVFALAMQIFENK